MTKGQTIEKLKALYTNAVAAMLRADACGDDESAKVMTEYAETLNAAINALETALQTDGDSISRQGAIDAINALHDKPNAWLDCAVDAVMALPSVQPEERTKERTETHACDCVSRQAAIEALYSVLFDDDLKPTIVTAKQADTIMDSIRWLPSAQPEIIRCRDCKWQKDQSGSTAWLPCRALVTPPDFYCGRAERRTDE